jgi:hypothetical protein
VQPRLTSATAHANRAAMNRLEAACREHDCHVEIEVQGHPDRQVGYLALQVCRAIEGGGTIVAFERRIDAADERVGRAALELADCLDHS